MNQASHNITIVTCCTDDWGGSEELWSRSIPLFQEAGYHITLFKNRFNFQHTAIKRLKDLGVALKPLQPNHSIESRAFEKVKGFSKKLIPSVLKKASPSPVYQPVFKEAMKKNRARLVIIAQGINFDGLDFGYLCFELKIPYIIIAQKAVEFYWPPPLERKWMKQALDNALKLFFVSHQNKNLTEEQFGFRFPKAEVVSNPVILDRRPLAYPSTKGGFKLACVARLFIIDKGQDMLLRILQLPKWKQRPLTISFIGSGVDETGLQEMAQLLKITQVEFKGQVEAISEVWAQHHALILPSRSEGMALSVMEAMAAGRTVITTLAGGHAEIIQDGINGFISESNFSNIEACMERAWANKDRWEEMGQKANQFIQQHIPPSPEKNFSLSILNLLNEN